MFPWKLGEEPFTPAKMSRLSSGWVYDDALTHTTNVRSRIQGWTELSLHPNVKHQGGISALPTPRTVRLGSTCPETWDMPLGDMATYLPYGCHHGIVVTPILHGKRAGTVNCQSVSASTILQAQKWRTNVRPQPGLFRSTGTMKFCTFKASGTTKLYINTRQFMLTLSACSTIG